MHSKTHFKFPFKSSKISTVSVKNIFFSNTSLPKEHCTIYCTILKLPNWRSKNYKTHSNLEYINYPILSLPLTGGTCWTEDPRVSETRTEQAVLRYWRSQSSLTVNSPAVTSSRWDLLDLAHRLVYLVGPLVGASDDGGDHGGTEEWDGGATLVEAMAKQSKARTSFYGI